MTTEADIKKCSKLVIPMPDESCISLDICEEFKSSVDNGNAPKGFKEIYHTAKFCESLGHYVVIWLKDNMHSAFPAILYPIGEQKEDVVLPAAMSVVMYCGCCKCLGPFCATRNNKPYLFGNNSEVTFEEVENKDGAYTYLCTYVQDNTDKDAIDTTSAVLLFKDKGDGTDVVFAGSWNGDKNCFQDINGEKLEVDGEIVAKTKEKINDIQGRIKQCFKERKGN